MDIQSFIQSGLLEAYVAGQCTATERQEVEYMVEQHPEVKAELSKIEQALEHYAFANAIAPPAGLKDRILEQLDKTAEVPVSKPVAQPAPAAAPLRLYQIITVTLAVLASFFFWRSMFISSENERLKNSQNALQAQVDDCAKQREISQPMANLLRDTDTRQVTLTDGKVYHITVFNNKIRKECALDISGLPVPSKGKYFQCWAIVDGKPVSLGMVQMNATAGWQPLKYHENVQAYAISEEPTPEGSATPTTVLAAGNLEVG